MSTRKDSLRAQLLSKHMVPTRRSCDVTTSAISVRTLMFYIPMADEPDVSPLIRGEVTKGRTVCVPRIDASRRSMEAVVITDLDQDTEPVPGMSRVRHARAGLPVLDPSTLDAVFVPGIAFDLQGGRLGRGAGYYDRFLARVGPRTRIVGVCFDHQILDAVPMEAHDVRMHALLTPGGWRDVRVP